MNETFVVPSLSSVRSCTETGIAAISERSGSSSRAAR